MLAAVTAPGGSGTINVIAASGGDCSACHDTWTWTDHTHHTLGSNLVVADADCATCHDATPGGEAARDAIDPPYVASGEVHNTTSGGDGCAACHNTTTGAKISLAGTAVGLHYIARFRLRP
jgi:hypothetical protein